MTAARQPEVDEDQQHERDDRHERRDRDRARRDRSREHDERGDGDGRSDRDHAADLRAEVPPVYVRIGLRWFLSLGAAAVRSDGSASRRRSSARNIEGVPVGRFRTAVAFASLSVATAAVATPAAAQAPVAPSPPPRTITVTGTAQVKPQPRNRKSNASIKKAVGAARSEAVPLAIANGGARAAELSRLSGLAIGELIAIAATAPGPR